MRALQRPAKSEATFLETVPVQGGVEAEVLRHSEVGREGPSVKSRIRSDLEDPGPVHLTEADGCKPV